MLLLLLATVVAHAQQPRRYSGKVERVDLAEGLVVVEELGAKGRLLRHEVHVAAHTPIVAAGRLRAWEMRSVRGYGEQAVSLADVLAGDFVVVESVQEGGRTLALRITIVENPAPSGRSR